MDINRKNWPGMIMGKKPHIGKVYSVACSGVSSIESIPTRIANHAQDGKAAASASQDGRIIWWDTSGLSAPTRKYDIPLRTTWYIRFISIHPRLKHFCKQFQGDDGYLLPN